MNTPRSHEDDQFAALLEQPHVDDGGFANQVMVHIPPSPPRWYRALPVVLGGGAAALLPVFSPVVRAVVVDVFGGVAGAAAGGPVGIVAVAAAVTLMALCLVPAAEEG
jgi:hypothetical protein